MRGFYDDPNGLEPPLPILGKGGFGTVRAVRRLGGEQNGEWFALKKTRDDITYLRKEFSNSESLLPEPNSTAKTFYFSAIDVIDVYKSPPQRHERQEPYATQIVLELGEPINFTSFYFASLTPADQQEFIIDLLESLQASHRRGVYHCDIKPDNIMYKTRSNSDNGAEKKRPSLIDFGLATKKEISTQFVGTPKWMAPEVLKHRAPYYAKTADIYSIGLVIAMLSGESEITTFLKYHPKSQLSQLTAQRQAVADRILGDSRSTPVQRAFAQMIQTNCKNRASLDTLINELKETRPTAKVDDS